MSRMICVSTQIPEMLRDGVLTLAHQSDLSFADALTRVIEIGLENVQRHLRSAVAEPQAVESPTPRSAVT